MLLLAYWHGKTFIVFLGISIAGGLWSKPLGAHKQVWDGGVRWIGLHDRKQLILNTVNLAGNPKRTYRYYVYLTRLDIAVNCQV